MLLSILFVVCIDRSDGTPTIVAIHHFLQFLLSLMEVGLGEICGLRILFSPFFIGIRIFLFDGL